ncbi:unnamed protein product [Arabidopsis lyrata]|nr:unnamed protein product [Arabidopsis lyrata]
MTRKGSSLILINKYIKLLTPNLSEEDQAAFKKSFVWTVKPSFFS